MLSRNILTQGIISEDQFITDVTNLFKRRDISFGDPKDLERLGSDLAADEALRCGLFNLCTVISHMSEVELTPQQLLVLVARASGGPAIFNAEGVISIPPDTESTFLTGYEAWTTRELDFNAFSESRHSDPFHTALTLSAAEGFHAPGHPTTTPSSPRVISPNATLESLTLAELRQYLDEIERRVSRIEPLLNTEPLLSTEPHSNTEPRLSSEPHLNHLETHEQQSPDISPSAMHPEHLNGSHSLRVHEVHSVAPAIEPPPIPTEAPPPAPEPELIEASADPTVDIANEPALTEHSTTPIRETETPQPAHEEPALAALFVVPTQPHTPRIQLHSEDNTPILDTAATKPATNASPDASRLRRLRTANVVLGILLVVSVAFASTVAVRYVNSRSQPTKLTGSGDSTTPAAESATQPNTQPPEPPSTTRATATSLTPPRPTPATQPAKISQALAAALTQPDAVVYPSPAPSSETKPSEANPPAPVIRQAPEPAPAQAASTPASPPSESKPAESTTQPEQRTEAPPTRQAPAPAPVQVAEARPAAPATAPAAVPANVPATTYRPSPPSSGIVNVPSLKMLPLAITSPQPLDPLGRHRSTDTTVEVMAIISKEGRVTSVQAVSGNADVRPAAVQAMQNWRFRPYKVAGQPVEVVTTFRFLFKAQ